MCSSSFSYRFFHSSRSCGGRCACRVRICNRSRRSLQAPPPPSAPLPVVFRRAVPPTCACSPRSPARPVHKPPIVFSPSSTWRASEQAMVGFNSNEDRKEGKSPSIPTAHLHPLPCLLLQPPLQVHIDPLQLLNPTLLHDIEVMVAARIHARRAEAAQRLLCVSQSARWRGRQPGVVSRSIDLDGSHLFRLAHPRHQSRRTHHDQVPAF